jgi:predicted RNA-binding protein with PIN domain
VTLFVDGYNLIFAASRRMSGFDIHHTEAARDKLIDLFVKYRAARPERILIFFDGGPEAAHLPRRQMVRGLDVLFSDVKSDADTDIKNAVSHDDNPRGIRVISSDMAIRNFVHRYGTLVTESEEFLRELEETLRDSALPQDEPIEKYQGGGNDETDFWLKTFGMDDTAEGKK